MHQRQRTGGRAVFRQDDLHGGRQPGPQIAQREPQPHGRVVGRARRQGIRVGQRSHQQLVEHGAAHEAGLIDLPQVRIAVAAAAAGGPRDRAVLVEERVGGFVDFRIHEREEPHILKGVGRRVRHHVGQPQVRAVGRQVRAEGHRETDGQRMGGEPRTGAVIHAIEVEVLRVQERVQLVDQPGRAKRQRLAVDHAAAPAGGKRTGNDRRRHRMRDQQ